MRLWAAKVLALVLAQLQSRVPGQYGGYSPPKLTIAFCSLISAFCIQATRFALYHLRFRLFFHVCLCQKHILY